jgi:hypothetical protein
VEKSKKLIFTLILVLVVLISIEGLARLTYFIMFGQNYDYARMYNFMTHGKYGPSDEFVRWWDREIIHPYLGFACDFGDAQKNKETYGISFNGTPLLKKEPDRLNVVILGGSVAQSMGDALKTAFTSLCRVPPNVITVAMGGYKQPQQLLALSFFLSLGAEYHLVINLDGYNEIVLPISDNYRVGVYPFYPRNWNLRISRQPSKNILAVIGKVRYLRDLKEDNLAGLNSSFFKGSAVFGIVKMLQFKRLNREINRSNHQLLKLQQEEVKTFEETGPFSEYADIDQLYQEAAGVWVRSSILLDRLARENGAEYYHFLQPNQYVEGSKVLSPEEKQLAYRPELSFTEPAIIGYPILIRQGQSLLKTKVNFFDATRVFAPEKRTVYIDTCCHFNDLGKKLLADYIMTKIKADPKVNKFFKKGEAAAAAPPPAPSSRKNRLP